MSYVSGDGRYLQRAVIIESDQEDVRGSWNKAKEVKSSLSQPRNSANPRDSESDNSANFSPTKVPKTARVLNKKPTEPALLHQARPFSAVEQRKTPGVTSVRRLPVESELVIPAVKRGARERELRCMSPRGGSIPRMLRERRKKRKQLDPE